MPQLLLRYQVKHPHRVMRRQSPERVIETSKYLAGLVMPSPPEIKRQLPEPANSFGQRTPFEFHMLYFNRSILGKQTPVLILNFDNTSHDPGVIMARRRIARDCRTESFASAFR